MGLPNWSWFSLLRIKKSDGDIVMSTHSRAQQSRAQKSTEEVRIVRSLVDYILTINLIHF